MSKRNNSTSNGGIGFVGLLTIVFIALKLTSYIDWSWWWVLSPLWIAGSVAFLLLVILVALKMCEPPVARSMRNLAKHLEPRP